jgi:CheY-like chemotaxis protein
MPRLVPTSKRHQS